MKGKLLIAGLVMAAVGLGGMAGLDPSITSLFGRSPTGNFTGFPGGNNTGNFTRPSGNNTITSSLIGGGLGITNYISIALLVIGIAGVALIAISTLHSGKSKKQKKETVT